jgi:hypothetical protein
MRLSTNITITEKLLLALRFGFLKLVIPFEVSRMHESSAGSLFLCSFLTIGRRHRYKFRVLAQYFPTPNFISHLMFHSLASTISTLNTTRYSPADLRPLRMCTGQIDLARKTPICTGRHRHGFRD